VSSGLGNDEPEDLLSAPLPLLVGSNGRRLRDESGAIDHYSDAKYIESKYIESSRFTEYSEA